jgi:ribosome-binding factor A
MPTRRQERVNGRIVEEVSTALRELKDPNLDLERITVTGAEVAPDLRDARVYVSVLGPPEMLEKNLDVLRRARKLLRARVGKRLGLKFSPDLHFQKDRSAARAVEISHLIEAARASDPNPGELPGEEAGEDERTDGGADTDAPGAAPGSHRTDPPPASPSRDDWTYE